MSDKPGEVMARLIHPLAFAKWDHEDGCELSGDFMCADSAREIAIERAQTFIAALEQAGYVVVPKEPTEEMICNGDTEILAALNDHSGVRRNPTPAHSAYRAMLSTLSVGEGK